MSVQQGSLCHSSPSGGFSLTSEAEVGGGGDLGSTASPQPQMNEAGFLLLRGYLSRPLQIPIHMKAVQPIMLISLKMKIWSHLPSICVRSTVP